MIDTHSHILPGVDDGSRNLQESLEMLKMAANDGVKVQVLTPHFPNNIYGASIEALTIIYENFRNHAARANISVELRFAAEVKVSDELIPLVKADAIPFMGTIGDRRVFLMEFPFSQLTPGLINLVHWLASFGISPLIAHPERNKTIQKDISQILPFLDAGCYLQVTAGSLNGIFGKSVYNTAVELLKLKTLTVIATDCHRVSARPPGALKQAMKIAEKIVGEKLAYDMVVTIPQQILGGSNRLA